MKSGAWTLLGLALFTTTLGISPGAVAAKGSPVPPITVRITLQQHQAVAGTSILGTVFLTNTTPRDITVDTCALNGWLAVGLHGRVDSLPFAHTAIGCAPSVHLAPGTNRFGVTVITTYAGCAQPEPAGNSPSTPLMPTCTVTGPPPLPAGTYSTKVDIVGLRGLTGAPNRVVVHVRSPKHPPPLAACADLPGRALSSVTVPDVVGANAMAAASVLAGVCLHAGYTTPVGSWVTSQTPAAGSRVPEHSTVTLTTGPGSRVSSG